MKRVVPQIILFFSILICCVTASAQDTVSLAGEWSVRLDSSSMGGVIRLPGTLDDAGYGNKTEGSDYGILSRRNKFIGRAWYNRQIEIPKSWSADEVVLYLERVMWSSEVFINGKAIGTQDGLGTPHYHNLGVLKPGKHQLSICINNDMIHNVGDKGHSYGEYTQIIWNGMIGRIELQKAPKTSLKKLNVWPNASSKTTEITVEISNKNSSKNGVINYTITDLATNKIVKTHNLKIALTDTVRAFAFEVDMGANVKLWDEFTPNLYSLDVTLKAGKSSSKVSTTFGFRDISTTKSKITINGRPSFMRGNLDCLHFPLTGYPSCDVEQWLKIFKIYKNHGLNHVRFHSWCPPKAAFEAADRLGIYIQAEVLWIDWWMSIVNNDRPEMTTKGLPNGLGKNPSADAFVQAELLRMVEAYGNHPSFTMLCIGNELGNSDFTIMQKWIDSIKQNDNRRLYSVSTARTITPVDQFMATHNIPGAGSTYGFKSGGTDYDFEQNYSKAQIPILAHELGQYPVYPRWNEINKYTGVLEARNLQELKQLAAKNDLLTMDSLFHNASGALQTLLYKSLIENLYRTAACGGFQMLSMTDYSGQGEALVGWLDSFWDSKGIVTPEEFKKYSNSVVLLSRFAKYVWSAGENFSTSFAIANYGSTDINQSLSWQLLDSKGNVVVSGVVDGNAKQGQLSNYEKVEFALPMVGKSEKFTLAVSCDEYKNDWPLWVFPLEEASAGDILIAERYDSTVELALNEGRKVLLLAHNLGRQKDVTPLFFTPLFWSTSFFPGQSNQTLGLYIDSKHKALEGFVTDNHSDWQWQGLSRGRAFNLNNYPHITPIVQPISDFHISNRLASVFECSVGKGRLLVCGHNISDTLVEAKALKNSLVHYMNSSDFAPIHQVENNALREMFYSIPQTKTVLPKGFEKSIFYVACGELLANDGSEKWELKYDNILAQDKSCHYVVKCDNVWRDAHGTAWTGREITVEIKTPNGILADLYVKLEDWNAQKRKAIVSIEGRETSVDEIGADGKWIKLFVMREDTNDGKITFKVRTTHGGNAMISKVALLKSE